MKRNPSYGLAVLMMGFAMLRPSYASGDVAAPCLRDYEAGVIAILTAAAYFFLAKLAHGDCGCGAVPRAKTLFEACRDVADRLRAAHLDEFDLAVRRRERLRQVDAADRLIVVRPEIPAQVFEIRRAGPRGHLGDRLAVLGLTHGAVGNVEIVEDVERLQHRLRRGVGRQRRLRKCD